VSSRLVIFALALLILDSATVTAAQERTRLVIGYSAMQAPVAPLWVAQEQGFFTKYGIEPELVFVRTTSVHIAGLISGHIDLSYGGGSGILPVAGRGIDLRFIASFGSHLQNKRMGVVSVGGTQWITTKLGLEYLGVDEQRDKIRMLPIGDQSILRGALESGNIDAAFFNGALAEDLRSKGFRILADLHSANIKTLSSGVIVKGTSLQKERTLTTNLLQAVIEGLAFVKSPTQKPKVIRTLMEKLKITDTAIAEQGYRYLQRDLDVGLYPAVEGLKNLQRFMQTYNPRVGEVNTTDLVDDSVVRGLIDNGFVEKTFRSYGLKY
jgi:ABC-type nitrate/sulfonate/bicarbonate transport system substrate-binding protein